MPDGNPPNRFVLVGTYSDRIYTQVAIRPNQKKVDLGGFRPARITWEAHLGEVHQGRWRAGRELVCKLQKLARHLVVGLRIGEHDTYSVVDGFSTES
jgi:hypothetical protein